jgi:hypothetical protein
VLDDLLTLFRRRRAPARARRPAAADGRSRINLTTMGGPIGAGNGGDWMPQAGQRIQPRVQNYAGEDDDIAAEAEARAHAQAQAHGYARQAAQHAEPQYYADQEAYRQPQAQPQAYVQHAEARAPQRVARW